MEIQDSNMPDNGSDLVSIEKLPKTALQAIYHAATGKVESLSKELRGNVIISSGDIDRLYDMLVDQLGLHEKMIEPTSTVVLKNDSAKSTTYSSWERYKVLRVNNHDITSEITLKLEFVIKLPETVSPQRCIVNINLDSSLPIISAEAKEEQNRHDFGFFMIFGKKWNTVKLSIDFVDFLIAKQFMGVVEEWFSTLPSPPVSKINNVLHDNFRLLGSIFSQLGRIGMASFLGAYIWFYGDKPLSISQLTVAVAIGLLIWAVFQIVQGPMRDKLLKRVAVNIIPSVILLTDSDQTAYNKAISSTNSAINTLISYGLVIIFSIGVNVISSFVYTYLIGG